MTKTDLKIVGNDRDAVSDTYIELLILTDRLSDKTIRLEALRMKAKIMAPKGLKLFRKIKIL